MKEIPLTQGKVAVVDDADYERLSQYKWYARQHKKKTGLFNCWYAQRSYRVAGGKQTTIFMHREILGAVKGIEVDHRDGNSLNNQRSNLRLATRGQNLANQKKYRGNSQYKGVFFHTGRKRFVAQIQVDKKVHQLGAFKVEADAARAYDRAAREHFGEFAKTNFQ